MFSFSGGSLSEVFYGLSRIRSKNSNLGQLDRILAFVLAVALPYIQSKLENLISKWEIDCDNGVVDSKEAKRMRMTKKVYSISKGIHDCFQVFQYIGYLSDRNESHSILNRLIGQHLIYLPPESDIQWNWSDLFSINFHKSAVLTGMLFRALELSAFFLQFVQWWQNETSNGSLTKLPNPDAPTLSGKNANAAGRYRNICPICLQNWKIPTVNRVSG